MLKTQTINPIQSDSVTILPCIQRTQEFMQFVQWFATPRELREHKNQKDFSKSIGVCEDTLTDWKKNPTFWPLVQQAISNWMKECIPDVIGGLYFKACKKGNAKDVEAFLRLAGMKINKPKK